MKILKERSEWFPIPKDPDKARLKLAYLNSGKRQEVFQGANSLKVSVRDGVEETASIPDSVKLREDIVDARILDWDGIIDEETGKKLECNRENKIKFSCQDGNMDILNKMVEKLDKAIAADLKKETKN